MKDMRSMVKVNGTEHEAPEAFRASLLVALSGYSGRYRIIADVDGLPYGREWHANEWIVPQYDGRAFHVLTTASGPGGWDDRVATIARALAREESE